jgi:CotH protein/lamin tail-like protein/chitobiase/beta-hexosaminidase-like protein/type IX secretion system substrate protein
MTKTISILIGLIFFSSINLNAQLSINEIMASNTSFITDDAGEYDDWIEIYNGGSQTIVLAGYYLSDDLTDPLKWQIPPDNPTFTTIEAGGFLILWADNDPEQGPHHLDFKLSGSGEDLILTHPNGVDVLDQISFSNQIADISYGRSTDGGIDFQLFSNPTPGASNNGNPGGLTFPVEFCVQVANDFEDAVEKENGVVEVTGFGIQMGEDFSGGLNTTGLRFPIALPEGAIIDYATIQFKAAGPTDTIPTDWTIKAQKIAEAPAFESSDFNVSQRVTTSASINWAPISWSSSGTFGVDNDESPNIAPLIQEVIDLGGWQEGNSIVIIIAGTGMRNAFGGDDTGNNFGPILCIEASVPYPSDPIANLMINEIAAAGTPYVDEQGDREDWIELYNANNFEVDLSGFYLTDDYGDLDKSKIPDGVVIPANSYLTFFADRDEEDGDLHTNFNLRSKGESVALAMQLATGLVILDSISFDDAPFMSSFGRQTDGANEWILFGAPTPDASNNGANRYLAPPDFSLPSGIYDNTQEVTEITHTEPDVTIYYTTDASIPDDSDFEYTGSIPILGTQNIQAIAYKNGYEPSQIANAAYLLNVSSNIPIIYLTTDYNNFFDPEIGIYVTGTNGIPLCGMDSANYNQDWERPINVKMFLPDGSEVFDVNAGVKISGVCSRNNAMKSLAISLREKDYGNGELGYRLFENRDHNNYLRFKLRNSGQDYSRMGFRDMVNQALLVGVVPDLEFQNGRPARVYLNGQFWGIHNIREKYTGEFFEDNFGADPNEIDILKSPGLPWQEIKQGSADEFSTLFDFVQNNSLVDETNYQYFEENVDINAFLNYWITMTYLANTDWPANNLTIWKEQKAGKKWRYCVADTDGSTKNFLTELSLPEYNTLDSIMVSNSVVWPNHSNSTLFLRRLVEREDFRNEFVQRTCSFIGLVYSEQRAHFFADSIKALYAPNIEDHLIKWGDEGALGALGVDMSEDIITWEGWIDAYKEFFSERPDYFRLYMDNYFNLNSTYNLTFIFDESTLGRVVVNTSDMEMPYNFSNLYFKDIPLRVKAIAEPGAVFSHWLETGITDPEIDFISSIDATLTPIFICAIPPGTACDDGDDCTENDIIEADCECRGTIPDNNGDGEMNELDCDFIDSVEPNLPKPTLKIFPNPAHRNVTIELSNAPINTVEVYNSAGIRLLSKKNLIGFQHKISVISMPQGIYFVKIQAADGNFYYGNFSIARK